MEMHWKQQERLIDCEQTQCICDLNASRLMPSKSYNY